MIKQCLDEGSLITQPPRSDRRGYVRKEEQGSTSQIDQPKPAGVNLTLRVPQPGSGNGQQIRCDICGHNMAGKLSLEHHRKNLHPSSQPVKWRPEVLNQTYALSPEVKQHLNATANPYIPEMIPSQVFVSQDSDAVNKL